MWLSEQAPAEQHVYLRTLPSGGYVAIAAEPVQPLFAPSRMRGRVVVERRAEPRRQGHIPPVVAVAERDDVASILAALMPLAESDELLSQTLLRRATVPITRRRTLPGD